MKIVVFLIAVFVLLWLLRGSAGRRAPPAAPSAGTRPAQQMLACAQCGIHLPRDETLAGRGGVFCGEAHRAAYEKTHPGAS